MEEWKTIQGFENYAVSNMGRVKNQKRNKIMKLGLTTWDYLGIQLYKNGKGYHKQVHQLVAAAFIENPEHKLYVNHKDEDKTNNSVENLEWVTAKENCNYGTRNERIARKAHDRQSNWTKEKRSEMARKRESKMSPAERSARSYRAWETRRRNQSNKEEK